MGRLLEFLSLSLIPFLFGGNHAVQTKMGISSGPMTLKFWQSPHFQNHDFEKRKTFLSRVPLKSGQVCKKWSSQRADHSGKKWAIFIFPLKMIQRGDHWMIFFIYLQHKTLEFCKVYTCFLFLFNLMIDIFVYTAHVLRHHINFQRRPSFLLFFVLLS